MMKQKKVWLVGCTVTLLTAYGVNAGIAGNGEADVLPAAVVAVEHGGEAMTAISEVRRGQRVTLRGEVQRIRDEDEFTLKDSTGRIKVYTGWKNEMHVAEGDTVIVEGRADDDVIPLMRPEIYASALILANGDRVNLRTGQVTPAAKAGGKD
jgi:uncharacterized protein YdeI (BOF family)